MSEEENEKASGGFVLGLILGAFLGAVVFFFLGTERGRKLKKELQKKGSLTFKDVAEILQELQEKKEVFKEKVEEKIEEIKERGAEEGKKAQKTVAEIEKQIKQETDELPSHLQQIQEKGRLIAHKFFRRNGKSLK